MQNRTRLVSILVALAILAFASWFVNRFRIQDLPSIPRNTQPFPDDKKFLVGVNYPWFSYGNDFGDSFWGHNGVSTPATADAVEHDFADLESQGVTVVRWFLFADGHSGIRWDPDGTALGLDKDVFDDMDAALAIAKRHHIRIMFVMVDFKFFEGETYGAEGHNWGAHDKVVTDDRVRASFLERVVRPLLERYGKDPTIAAWEVVNEPEWELGKSIRWGRKDFPRSEMESFVGSVVSDIHRYSNQPATVGTLTRSLLPMWRFAGLDFYEVHSYPYTEILEPFDYPISSLHLDKPTLLGEFPTAHSKRTVTGYLDLAHKDGYAGAFAWSYRASDRYSNYRGAQKRIAAWKRAH